MEPIYTKHVTTLPDQGGEGTSRLLRHLDPAARAPDALDASEIPSVEKVTACLDDLEVLVARETRANHRLRKEAAARGDRIRSGLKRFGEDVGEEAVSTRAPMGEASKAFADHKLAEAGDNTLAGEDKLLSKAQHRLERRQSLQTTIEGIVSCAKTEALLPKKNGSGWALAVKDAAAWGRAALVAEPVPDVAAMAREKRRERRRSKGDPQKDAKRAAAKKKKEAPLPASDVPATASPRWRRGERTVAPSERERDTVVRHTGYQKARGVGRIEA